MKNNVVYMDHLAAWRDFYDVVRPGIWAALNAEDRKAVSSAERDYWGKRRYRKGGVIPLGPERVERLLGRLAPGRYGVERVVRFWRVG